MRCGSSCVWVSNLSKSQLPFPALRHAWAAFQIALEPWLSFRLILPILLLAPHMAQAQTAPPPSADIQRERVEQLQELLRTKKDLQASQQAMQQQLAEFDARIAALEASLGVTPSQDEQPQGNSDATASTAAVASPDGMVYAKTSDPGPYEPGAPAGMGPYAKEAKSGPFPYEFGKGFVLARGPNGEVDWITSWHSPAISAPSASAQPSWIPTLIRSLACFTGCRPPVSSGRVRGVGTGKGHPVCEQDTFQHRTNTGTGRAHCRRSSTAEQTAARAEV